MIGQPTNVCQFEVCDSTTTKGYTDNFRIFNLKQQTKSIKYERVNLCEPHMRLMRDARLDGHELCITPEGWLYVD